MPILEGENIVQEEQGMNSDNLYSSVFVGRQPIFDKQQRVFGYELLFRSGTVNAAGQFDGDQASAQVIYNALLEIGLDNLIGNKIAFINLTNELLNSGIPRLLPPNRTVLEILESADIDQNLATSVAEFSKQGFSIALDDFVYSSEWEPILQHADIIKVDVFGKTPSDIERQFEFLKTRSARLLAEKVETGQEYDVYKKMGFDYFQGYFFAKPNIVQSEKLPDNHIALLQLIAKLQSNEVTLEEIEYLVSQTVSLNYKLFRYINSAFIGLPRKFNSVSEAVVYIGLQKLKDIACLIAITGVENKSTELITTGLCRARMCELMAMQTGHQDVKRFFVVGLFSILEALLDHPLTNILEKLPLSREVIDALTEHKGDMGQALLCSIECERSLWPQVSFGNLSKAQLNQLYREGIDWANQVSADIM